MGFAVFTSMLEANSFINKNGMSCADPLNLFHFVVKSH